MVDAVNALTSPTDYTPIYHTQLIVLCRPRRSQCLSSISRGNIASFLPTSWPHKARIWTSHLDRPSKETGFHRRAPSSRHRPLGKSRFSGGVLLTYSFVSPPFPSAAPVCPSLLKTISDGGGGHAISARADERVPRRACSRRCFLTCDFLDRMSLKDAVCIYLKCMGDGACRPYDLVWERGESLHGHYGQDLDPNIPLNHRIAFIRWFNLPFRDSHQERC
jgi:hypothetical protein